MDLYWIVYFYKKMARIYLFTYDMRLFHIVKYENKTTSVLISTYESLINIMMVLKGWHLYVQNWWWKYREIGFIQSFGDGWLWLRPYNYLFITHKLLLVTVKHFFNIFYKFWSGRFRIYRKYWRNVSYVLHSQRCM